ncbi:MAG: hypothetical protein HXO84_08325, partial [Selenomonas sp.]|nr:hypothetical protein [Selenomonas sp.]
AVQIAAELLHIVPALVRIAVPHRIEQGEDTCICPACQAGKAILANQAVIG